MPAHDLEMIANVSTMFTADGGFDEAATAAHMRRLVDARVGLFVCSPGSGEVHYISRQEFVRVCELAVQIGKGKVPVYSMTPECHTTDETLEFARLAAKAGVDVVQYFQLMGGHGLIPTREEQRRYWRKLLTASDFPVALSLHGICGYLAPPDLVEELCNEFRNIRTLYTYASSFKYITQLRDLAPRIPLGVHIPEGVQDMALGATILTGSEPNVIPNTSRALIDCYAAADIPGLERAAGRIQRLGDALLPWGRHNSRMLKMAYSVLGLPGGAGALREPLVMPADAELRTMAASLERLGVREWEGLPVPA